MTRRLHLKTEIELSQVANLFPALYDPNTIGAFVLANSSVIFSQYGLNGLGATQLKGYIAYIAFEYTNKTLGIVFAQGGGLFTRRTVRVCKCTGL